MSAWVVSKLHIDVLVSALIEFKVEHKLGDDETEIGRKLWRENVDSVSYRYDLPNRDDDRKTELAEYKAAIKAYSWRELVTLKPGAALNLVDCYAYQSCEHPGWDASEAKAAMDQLTYKLTLAGAKRAGWSYEAAPWGVDSEEELARICDQPKAISLSSLLVKHERARARK